MPQYKYYIGETEVFPINDSKQTYKYERSTPATVVFDVEIGDQFEFTQQNSGFDFKAQEAADLCEELAFSIFQRCGSDAYALLWEGVFAISEGSFDNYKCTYEIKPRKKLYLLSDVEVNILDVPERVKGSSVTGVVTGLSTAARTYPNCRWLSDVILYVAQASNTKITGLISNLFQINPDDVFPLAGVTNYWQYMVLASLSDIQEPVPSDSATIEVVTFNTLMNDLLTMFDAHWFIDENYKLRIEHSTYFEGTVGLDLTASIFAKYVRGSEKYNYDLEDIPKQEIWEIAEHQQHVIITYGGLANLSKNKNAKTYQTQAIRTDFFRIRYGGENSTDDGLFLFATDGGVASGGTEIRMLEGGDQNFKMIPHILVTTFQTYSRPSLYGIIVSANKSQSATTSGGITLDSVRPLLKQEPFSVPLCCDQLDPRNQITTSLGTGYLDRAEYNGKTGMAKLELKYKINNCSDFQPSDLTGLDLWLKFDEGITKSGGRVSQWNDASGNNRHATQSGPTANRPKHVNGSAVSFRDDGNGGGGVEFQYLQTPSFQLFPSKRGTIIMLLANEAVPYVGGTTPLGPLGPMAVLSTLDGSPTNVWDICLTAAHAFISDWAGALYPVNGVPTLNNWGPNGLYMIRREVNDKLYGRLNSIECIDNPMIIPNQQQVSKPFIIGYNPQFQGTAGGYFELAELMVFGRVLTLNEMQEIELYLIKKGIYNRIYP